MRVDVSPNKNKNPTVGKRKPLPKLPGQEEEGVKLARPAKPPVPPSRQKKHDSEAKDYQKLGSDIELGSPVDSRQPEKDVAVAKESSKAAPASKERAPSAPTVNRFKGTNPLQYTLWAHFLCYGAASLCFCMGVFSMLWTDAETYKCRVREQYISSNFLFDSNGVCPTIYTHNGKMNEVCCNPNAKSDLQGYFGIGMFYVLYAIFLVLYENTDWGYGLYFPNDTFCFRNRLSPISWLHFIVGLAGCYNYATCLGGVCLITTAIVYQYGVYRSESGDGGREAKKKASAAAKAKRKDVTFQEKFAENINYCISFNPVTFCRRIYNEDKLSSYVWMAIFITINLLLFIYTLDEWYEIVETMRDELLNGKLKVNCDDLICHVNRKAVKYGPVSEVAPWAKACGVCLNLNCALLLLPVVRMLLRKLHNYGESFSKYQTNSDIFSRFFAHPLTRYIPLQKNIEFHKVCAVTIFFLTWGHMVAHWTNLIFANNTTLRLFRFGGWNGTDYFTGALATFAMFVIYSAAPDVVRFSKYEIFFRSHHFFTLFFLSLFLHGPSFFYWTAVPVLLYIAERIMQTRRGNRPFLLVKAEWISPVIALYFRPLNKEDFVFKEGQYLYLNCPAISPSQWHPFTISSAVDDLNMNAARIHLDSGEEVVEVPRPKNLPPNAKWNKYVLASQDWQAMDPLDYLDKSETGYHDYVSLHIKVHGLQEPVARSWTRKFKEYLELMSPGKKFPFYFSRRDSRGEVLVGRHFGPDGKTPIIRVDGPHAAPAEHYSHYGTLMLIGAGIGLTPCVSILTSLTKYRWRKSFNPEILHFYWIIRHNEVDSFQWLVHLLTDISFELKKARASNQIERRYYCEINIYVTAVEKDAKFAPLHNSKKQLQSKAGITPNFTAEELYEKMSHPTAEAKSQVKKMKETNPDNRLQDIWIWSGRPNWDEIFKDIKDQRQHSNIGVCFCGAASIGADLRTMCEKHSNVSEDCLFSLHKENF